SSLHSMEEGTSWLSPPAVVFDRRGVQIEMVPQALTKELWVVSDNNDELEIVVAFEGNTLGALLVPVVPEPGMRLRRIALPTHLVGQTVDQAMVKPRSEEHTSELQSRENLVCRLL